MSSEFKPLKDYQYRDPVTNRARNKPDHKRVKSKDATKYKPLKDYQYRDPVTNRARNKPDHKRSRSKKNL